MYLCFRFSRVSNDWCLFQPLVAASAAAMVSVQAVVVFVAGGICCLNAPTVIHRHYQLSSSPSKSVVTAEAGS